MSTKEVRFDVYCKQCKHYDLGEEKTPCWECLDQGWNENSHKPLYFEEAEANTNGKGKNV